MKHSEPNLPPILTHEDFETSEEYAEYLSIEQSDPPPPPASQARKTEFSQIASNTIHKIAEKKIPVGIRLPQRDIQRVKSVALQRGIPYQTLISSVIHQYLDGNLVEK